MKDKTPVQLSSFFSRRRLCLLDLPPIPSAFPLLKKSREACGKKTNVKRAPLDAISGEVDGSYIY